MSRTKKDVAEMYKSPFPIALRALMSEKPITTQEKLAEITGKTRQTVSQYVNGISEPGYDTLIKISDYFDVSIDYLLGRTKDRRKAPSVYDQLGLSEKSISTLKLAHKAKQAFYNRYEFSCEDVDMCNFIKVLEDLGHLDTLDKFKEYMPHEDSPPEVKLNWENFMQQNRAGYAFVFSRSLSQLVDEIIEIAMKDRNIANAYSEIVHQDCQPPEQESSVPEGYFDIKSRAMHIKMELVTIQEYVRFKIYEISNSISRHLLSKYVDGMCDYGND